MSFSRPSSPKPTSDEREMLLAFIRWQREQVVATAAGLTEEQLRWTPGDRLLSIIGIINHLTKMEWRWVEGRFLSSPFPPRDPEWVVDRGRSGHEIIEAYWLQAQRTEHIARAAQNLDDACLGAEGERGPAHVLLGFDEPITLRWVLLHLIEETAHHAGHADSTREMLDGTKMRAS